MDQYLALSLMLFYMGAFGMFLFRSHIIMVLMSLEMLLLSCVINFVIHSMLYFNLIGQVYAIFMLAMAASEISIGLSMVVIFYSLSGGVSFNLINLLSE